MADFFYLVVPRDKAYKSLEPLTYKSDKRLEIGQVVDIELRNRLTSGFVIENVAKPAFKTKLISASHEIVIPPSSIKLFSWMLDYYPDSLGTIAQHFFPSRIYPKIDARPATNVVKNANAFTLSKDQTTAIQAIKLGHTGTSILHGETGSGKTLVYIELASKVLDSKQNALVLVPEISLSPQIEKEFKKYFGDKVLVTHSGLSPKRRSEIWQQIESSSEPHIIIGPRSALFLPYKKLGLVVIDEFHDNAYKQESSPYYHSLRVAAKMSQIHNCPLVLGSATPPVSDYYWAEQKNVPIIKLSKISTKALNNSRDIELVDLSNSEERSSYPLLSNTLISSIKRSLDNKDQVLLFLNKRGSSRALVCQSCGWRSSCKRCDLPYTYHGDLHKLICHTCGSSLPVPTSCPDCNSTDIIFKSPGTKSIAQSIQKIFPDKNIARFDKDNRKGERIESRHQEIVQGDIDVLVGTQILSKGHDLPKLGLVGILQAESSLQFPDFSSNERSYQLIHQISGRVARGHRPGKVVIQSFNPDNQTLGDAALGKWDEFYHQEINQRKLFGFPPFYHILKTEVSKSSPLKAQETLEKIASKLEGQKGISLVGPSPCFIEKRANKYYWQLVIKSKNRSTLSRLAKSLPQEIKTDLDPTQLL